MRLNPRWNHSASDIIVPTASLLAPSPLWGYMRKSLPPHTALCTLHCVHHDISNVGFSRHAGSTCGGCAPTPSATAPNDQLEVSVLARALVLQAHCRCPHGTPTQVRDTLQELKTHNHKLKLRLRLEAALLSLFSLCCRNTRIQKRETFIHQTAVT